VATDHARVELFQLERFLPNVGIQCLRMLHSTDGDLQGLFHLFRVSYLFAAFEAFDAPLDN
jgi:hypothetical protein